MLVSGVNIFATRKNKFNLNAQNRISRLQARNQFDTVSFSSRVGFVNVHTPEEAEAVATKLSTSTSGLRRAYDDKFRKDAALLTQAIAAKLISDKVYIISLILD